MDIKPLPPQADLLDYYIYSVVTGDLYYRHQVQQHAAGSLAGSTDRQGYRTVKYRGTTYRAARLIWMMVTGQDPGDMDVDHINRVRDCNAWHNLQLATHKVNCQNIRRTGTLYLTRSRTRWYVRRWGKIYGDYSTKQDAMAAVWAMGWYTHP